MYFDTFQLCLAGKFKFGESRRERMEWGWGRRGGRGHRGCKGEETQKKIESLSMGNTYLKKKKKNPVWNYNQVIRRNSNKRIYQYPYFTYFN